MKVLHAEVVNNLAYRWDVLYEVECPACEGQGEYTGCDRCEDMGTLRGAHQCLPSCECAGMGNMGEAPCPCGGIGCTDRVACPVLVACTEAKTIDKYDVSEWGPGRDFRSAYPA